MMKQPTLAQIFTVGFATFAIYFGAGNLIFPPTLGFTSGSEWWLVILGFLVTGVGLPIIGIIATAKAGGSVEDLVKPLGNKFAAAIGVAISLCIGPLFCIPRTGATTFEIAVAPLFPEVNPFVISSVTAVIFFSVTALFTLSQSKVVDLVGQWLTPGLLIILAAIMGTAVFAPPAEAVFVDQPYQFGRGFKEGYQTMDALGSIVMAGIFVADVVNKGFVSTKEQLSLLKPAGLVAAVCLASIYAGLCYVGSTVSTLLPADIGRVDLLVGSVRILLGTPGTIALGMAVTLACLTTSIGLTSMVSSYFAKLCNNKVSYKAWVLIICLFSVAMAIQGVDTIVMLAINVLVILYPVVIVIIALNLMDHLITWKFTYIGAVFTAFVVSFCEVLGGYYGPFKVLVEAIPLAKDGFSWLLPSIIGGLIAYAIGAATKDKWVANAPKA